MQVQQFLQKIGRNCAELAPKFQSLEQLMSAKSHQMKEMGIDSPRRKYLLQWIDNYKNGIQPYAAEKPIRSPRGPKWRY